MPLCPASIPPSGSPDSRGLRARWIRFDAAAASTACRRCIHRRACTRAAEMATTKPAEEVTDELLDYEEDAAPEAEAEVAKEEDGAKASEVKK